jgi:hypothetical protein
MDKSKIPTDTFTVGEGENKINVEVYQWITKEEDKKYNEFITKGMSIDEGEDGNGEVKVQLRQVDIIEAKDYLVKCMLKNPSYEDYNVMMPKYRDEIEDRIYELYNEKKS